MIAFIRRCWENNRAIFWRWALQIYVGVAVTLLLLIQVLR